MKNHMRQDDPAAFGVVAICATVVMADGVPPVVNDHQCPGAEQTFADHGLGLSTDVIGRFGDECRRNAAWAPSGSWATAHAGVRLANWNTTGQFAAADVDGDPRINRVGYQTYTTRPSQQGNQVA